MVYDLQFTSCFLIVNASISHFNPMYASFACLCAAHLFCFVIFSCRFSQALFLFVPLICITMQILILPRLPPKGNCHIQWKIAFIAVVLQCLVDLSGVFSLPLLILHLPCTFIITHTHNIYVLFACCCGTSFSFVFSCSPQASQWYTPWCKFLFYLDLYLGRENEHSICSNITQFTLFFWLSMPTFYI